MKETFNAYGQSWSITAAKRIVKDRPTIVYQVKDAIGWFAYTDIDKAHALNTTNSDPIILAPITTETDSRVFPIDGWHRLYQAWINGVEEIQAVLLTPDEEQYIRNVVKMESRLLS